MPEAMLKSVGRFISKLDALYGALIIGSTAYGAATEKSDVDLMLISDNMQRTLASKVLQDIDRDSRIRKPEARLEQECDAHCFKGLFDGKLFSPAIYSPNTFQRITSIDVGNLEYVRNASNSGIEIKLYDFQRDVLKHTIKNQQLRSGHFFAWEPICLEGETLPTYFGPAPDSLLRSPIICLDTGKWLESEIKRFWIDVYRIMLKEARNPDELMRTGRLPVIENQNLPPHVYEYVAGKLKETKPYADNL